MQHFCWNKGITKFAIVNVCLKLSFLVCLHSQLYDYQWNHFTFTKMMSQPRAHVCVCLCLHVVVGKWWKGMSPQHLQDSHGQKYKIVAKGTNVKDSGVELYFYVEILTCWALLPEMDVMNMACCCLRCCKFYLARKNTFSVILGVSKTEKSFRIM